MNDLLKNVQQSQAPSFATHIHTHTMLFSDESESEFFPRSVCVHAQVATKVLREN